MPTNADAIETLRAARDVVETALDKATAERERQDLRVRHDDIADEIRALHRLRLDALTVPYAPITAHIAQSVQRLDRLKKRLVLLNKGARTVDQVLGVIARLMVLAA